MGHRKVNAMVQVKNVSAIWYHFFHPKLIDLLEYGIQFCNYLVLPNFPKIHPLHSPYPTYNYQVIQNMEIWLKEILIFVIKQKENFKYEPLTFVYFIQNIHAYPYHG